MNTVNYKLVLAFLFSFSFMSSVDHVINDNDVHDIMPCSVNHDSPPTIELSDPEKRVTEHNRAILDQMLLDGQVLKLPVRAIVFDGEDDWDTYLDEEEIQAEINKTNTKYLNEGFNVHLELVDYDVYENEDLNDGYDCSSSDSWDDCDQPTFWDPSGSYGASGYINLFYLNLDGPSQHANFPWSSNYNQANTVILNEDYLFNGWSLMHELGHTFGLYHTFNVGTTGSENVTRDPNNSCYDCEDDGDLLCDTPAALNQGFGDGSIATMTGGEDEDECGSDFSMSYVGNPTDACGDPYIMNALVYENIMNYGSRWCSQDYTDGQVARMWEHMAIKVSQLNMSLVDHCDFVNINLGSETVQNGQYIETPKKITSQQDIYSWDNQLNLYGADEGVTLLPGFHAHPESNFKAIPSADGCN